MPRRKLDRVSQMVSRAYLGRVARLILADALEDAGRDGEAALCRNTSASITGRGGTVRPTVTLEQAKAVVAAKGIGEWVRLEDCGPDAGLVVTLVFPTGPGWPKVIGWPCPSVMKTLANDWLADIAEWYYAHGRSGEFIYKRSLAMV